MGSSSVRFFHEHVLVKEPGATEPTPWHHDDPYYGIDGMQNVSMWIALDPVPASSGLQFIAGSHLSGRRFVPRKFIDQSPYGDADDRFELLPAGDALIDGQRLLGWDVEPGDVLAFHYRTLHGAPGNSLSTRRRAVSLRWLGDDARFGDRPADNLAALRTERPRGRRSARRRPEVPPRHRLTSTTYLARRGRTRRGRWRASAKMTAMTSSASCRARQPGQP